MRALAHLARRKGFDHLIAVTACVLLLVFAVGSKIAAYRPKQLGAKPIAATKDGQAKNVMADAGVTIAAQTGLAVVFLLGLCAGMVERLRATMRLGFHLRMECLSSISVSVRPPPAF